MSRKSYPSDLTDAQWALIEPLIPPALPGGRPRKHPMREVLNGLLYLTREGCSWRALPHDLPPWRTCHNYMAWFAADGTWDEVLTALRERARVAAGREATPSAACIDSQSVKTAGPGEERGRDAHKRVVGRKRHILTDTLGLLLMVVVSAADVDDGNAAPQVLAEVRPADFPRLETVFGDSKYNNRKLDAYLAAERPGWRVEVTEKPAEAKGFVPVKKRWVVEQAFGVLGRWRRHARDYERKTSSSEALIRLACIHRLARRLEPDVHRRPFRFKRAEKRT